VTLIVTVNGPDTIWLLADRRLSARGRRPNENGRKLMFLETTDGVAILGYAGLGATTGGTEPADWMSAVLRGRNMPLEQSLSVLAGALQRQFPRHLLRLAGPNPPVHNILIPAFVGASAHLYSIDMVFAHDRKSYKFRYTRHVVGGVGAKAGRTPRIGLAGSGLTQLMGKRQWARELLRLVRACDMQKISHNVVADHFATINHQVHLGATDGSVGPRCIVAWRNRKDGPHKGGGGQRYYTSKTLDRDAPALPSISNGMDVRALVNAIWPHMMASMPKPGESKGSLPELDVNALNAALAKLPEAPDETLK